MEIKLNPTNPRFIKDDKFKKLCESIKKDPEFLELRPIVIDKEGIIIGGNMRYRALLELGIPIKDEWVKQADKLTDEQRRKFIVIDNQEFGDNDWDALSTQYDIDELLEWGFDEKDLKIEKEVVEDEAPEVSDEPAVSKLGEVYQLGRHRLMCGDSTKIEDVEKLMDGQKADMVFTDPPYNVDYGGEQSPIWKKSIKKIENDNLTASGWISFCEDITSILSSYNNGPIYVCHAPGPDGRVIASILDKIFHWSATIIWKKDRLIPGRGHFQRQYEPIWYGWKGEHKEQSDRTATDVWEIKRPFSNDLHPTMKPVELVSKAILYSSYENQTVLDLFGGSGSTLIACEQTNRTCYGMELDPKYCDVIRKRYAKFIGKEDEWEKITPMLK